VRSRAPAVAISFAAALSSPIWKLQRRGSYRDLGVVVLQYVPFPSEGTHPDGYFLYLFESRPPRSRRDESAYASVLRLSFNDEEYAFDFRWIIIQQCLPLAPLGISLVAISWILPVWAIVLFRREGTEVEPTSPSNRKLITSGPYQFTRNPMYLGLVILTLGIAIWVGAWPMFAAPVALFATANWVHIPFQEAKMRRQFGAAYDDYVASVRCWI
jgi:hypothetical protein